LHLRCLRSVGYLTYDVEPAIDYAEFYIWSHNAVIRVYDAARNMIDVHERKGEFQRVVSLLLRLPGRG
jgi:hypothetical protein